MSQAARVLIVTGSDSVALRLRLMAEAEGAEAVIAADAAAAMREMANAPPDVVMADSTMERWRTIGPLPGTIPVLMVDSSRPDWDRLRHRLQIALAGNAPSEVEYLARSLAQARILVVDDSVTYREFLRHELERNGAEVVVCGSGAEGIAELETEEFDAVLLDLVMPGIDGLRLCGEMARLRRERGQNFILIVLTSREGRSDLLHSLEAGADFFLRKSQDTAMLSAKLGAVLRRKFLMSSSKV